MGLLAEETMTVPGRMVTVRLYRMGTAGGPSYVANVIGRSEWKGERGWRWRCSGADAAELERKLLAWDPARMVVGIHPGRGGQVPERMQARLDQMRLAWAATVRRAVAAVPR